MTSIHQITPAVRVVETDREWVIQAIEMKRSRRRAAGPTGAWTDRAFITSRSMLNMELKRLVGAKASLLGHVEQPVLDWLNGLPVRHPSRDRQPSVIDMLEAMSGSEHGETFHDHLPLIVKHGPLRYRNDRNARFEP
ncbi:MAG: hypothetical protein EOS63_04910 [Mesorhizobium sp.]|uniref:hypothetical protein n=1 Tax=Mesorhizobium sp. TaxID=1871066 RepID=UPI000FE71E1B|nr:hypothetical protein [Mesorhizobium sp.]RWE83467.1 MAG: hypothetical protein EOS63_04910 [Mesorhizobium sp.]TJW61353.1 MAG: hypothetical protein E5V97_20870 [Mesorhizobium sp.]